MTHIAQVGSLVVVSAAVAGAWGGPDNSGHPGGGTGAADSAAAAAAAASAERRVSNVMIGKRIGSGNRMAEPTFQFAPQDTVFVSVATEGTAGAGTLTAAWRSQTGEILQQSTDTIRTGQNTAFQLSRPKGLKPGTYKVVLFLGNDSADTKVFLVKK